MFFLIIYFYVHEIQNWNKITSWHCLYKFNLWILLPFSGVNGIHALYLKNVILPTNN